MTTANTSGTWTLGDLTVNRIGFGAMRLTGSAAFDARTVPRDRSRSIAVLRRAVELGVNHIDTAAFYFSSLRSANELINSALAPYRHDILIATKVGPGRNADGEWTTWARPDQLRGQVEENLRQLGRDQLDLVALRVRGKDSIADHFGALADLQTDGLVRHLGLSTITIEQLHEARTIAPVVSVQGRFGVDARSGIEVLRACGELGIAFIPYFAIAGHGREKGADASTEHSQIIEIARAGGVTPAQVRLAWTLAQGAHVLAIPGTGDLDHLEQNVAAGSLRLTDAELATIDSLADSLGAANPLAGSLGAAD